MQHALPSGTHTCALPPGAAGQWCRVSVAVAPGANWWARLELTDAARGQIVRACFLGPCRPGPHGGGRRSTLVHVPAQAGALTVHLLGRDAPAGAPRIEILSRSGAALRLLWQGRALIAKALSGDARGRLGRLRAVLGQAPARRGEVPPYAVWITQYESVLPGPGRAHGAPPQVIICGADETALAATLASVAAQELASQAWVSQAWASQAWASQALASQAGSPSKAQAGAPLLVRQASDWRGVTAPWVLLLQAGEVLAPDALAWFAHTASLHPEAQCITADCDFLGQERSGRDGRRERPLFKPGPDSLLLQSGLPLYGACAFRWPAAPPALPVPILPVPALPVDARQARRVLALRHPEAVMHISRILTHIGAAAAPLPAARVRTLTAPGFAPSVTALVPSALRSAHVAHCLSRVVGETDYPNFQVDLIITDSSAARPALLSRVQALPRVQVRQIALPDFNYAAANNKAAAAAGGELLLLLNDDVAPISKNWLHAMVAHMQDQRVGIVGARLLYGNGTVQHEGVILGLAHLAEHAGRLRDGADAGPHGLALLDRQVSAVTGACLLIRAELYRALGGMDESFAIALNDVDLCLRASRAGWRVVYCAQAEMWHYESLSLGRHYAGARAALESREVRLLRARWPDAIDNDPFYSALASLEPGREWQPGFPPRVPGLAEGQPNPAATG